MDEGSADVPGIIPSWSARASRGWRAGGARLVPPAVTRAALEPALARFGITRVGFLTGLDRIGVAVAMAVRPLSRSVAISLGKGVDRDAAFVSAVMEAIETWHAERIDRPLVFARLADLKAAGRRLADLAAIAAAGLGQVPPDHRIAWIEAEDLAAGTSRLVPFELVHTDWSLPLFAGTGYFAASTNGLASGNHIAEATLHALAELLERDASHRFHQLSPKERRRLRLDLATVKDPIARALCTRFAEAGLEVAVWRTPAVVPIASFLCLLRDRADPEGHAAIGAGCHPTARVALWRALFEAAQVRLTAIAGARDDLDPRDFEPKAQAARAQAQALLFADPESLDFAAVPDVERDDFGEDVEALIGDLLAAGFTQVLRVDLTRAEIGIAVVRLIVPGLRPDPHLPGTSRPSHAAPPPASAKA